MRDETTSEQGGTPSPGRPSVRASLRGDPTSRTGGIRRAVLVVAGILGVMLAGGAVTAVLSGHGGGQPTQQQLAQKTVKVSHSNRQLPASLGALMGIEKAHRSVMGFTLTDQHNKKVSLSTVLRHHAVVLAFMDDRCLDICPLVAQELVDAYHDLGPKAQQVDFVAVNVNAGHSSPRFLRSFIAQRGHGIATVPTFTYLTGSPAALRHIWAHYGITVKVAPDGTVYHSEAMYFISPGGAMRYVATPYANLRKNGTGWLPGPTITQWGKGIARYARRVLA